MSSYLELFQERIGSQVFSKLIDDFSEISSGDESNTCASIETQILDSPEFGPAGRNLIKLWYLGSWPALSDEWLERFGQSGSNMAGIPSSTAYIEGLVWKAMSAHPMGGKPPGFGSWSIPPVRIDKPSNTSRTKNV